MDAFFLFVFFLFVYFLVNGGWFWFWNKKEEASRKISSANLKTIVEFTIMPTPPLPDLPGDAADTRIPSLNELIQNRVDSPGEEEGGEPQQPQQRQQQQQQSSKF